MKILFRSTSGATPVDPALCSCSGYTSHELLLAVIQAHSDQNYMEMQPKVSGVMD